MAANDFFTVQSLATFAGTVGATTVVSNGLQRAFDFNPKWFALVIAEGLCLLAVFLSHQSAAPGVALFVSDYFVAVLNGFLVFCSASGVTTTGASAVGSVTPQAAGARERGAGGSVETVSRRFWSAW